MAEITYGTPNLEMLGRWLHLDPADDGPFWAVNLMRYRERAAYVDGDDHGRTGKEADDAYAPLDQLRAIGAVVALHGDVVRQAAGEPAWDRVGIVRYPSRRAFLDMQRRDDFKRQHEHKSAGMAFTIVLATSPAGDAGDEPTGDALVVRVVPEGTPAPADLDGARHVATLDVEGVIVGDERRWSRVRLDEAPDELVDALAAEVRDGAVCVVVHRDVDRLVRSIREP